MDRARILIVEDEDAIATGLRFNFEAEGYDAYVHANGPDALSFLEDEGSDIDLVVLDLMLPGMSGYEICRSIRESFPGMPILVLSARTLSEDKMHAFDCGTDQYMTKPFALPELLSRVRNLLNRSKRLSSATASEPLTEITFADVHINFQTFEVRRGEHAFPLTTMELQLLKYFIKNQGLVLSRNRILRDVWEQGADVSTRTIDNFVMRLRKYIEKDPANPEHLLSVRGTGYRFVLKEEPSS